MHQFIASYLFQNKACPLPGLGCLSVTETAATAYFSKNIITAPSPVIHFEPGEFNADPFISYLARETNTNAGEAAKALGLYCDKIKTEALAGSNIILEGVGHFIVNSDGELIFEMESIPAVFLQPVPAERVIHPKKEHTILVGDKETTNTEMAEYFKEGKNTSELWWTWAIILFVIALSILLFYFNDVNGSSEFGNAIKL